MLCSTDRKIFLKGLDLLRYSFSLYILAKENAKANSFIRELLKINPFHGRLMRGVAYMATAPLCITDESANGEDSQVHGVCVEWLGTDKSGRRQLSCMSVERVATQLTGPGA